MLLTPVKILEDRFVSIETRPNESVKFKLMLFCNQWRRPSYPKTSYGCMVDHHIRILLPSPLFPHPKPVSLYKRLADSEYMHFIALVHSLFAKTKAEGLVFEISHLNGNRPLRFVPKGEKHNRKEFFEAFHQDWKSACDTTTATVSRVASPALVTEEFHWYTRPDNCTVGSSFRHCIRH